MKKIAFAAAKGGTGKTTATVTLGHALALAGHRVLVVDCDPRADVGLHFGLAPMPGLAQWLAGAAAPAIEVRSGLHVLPSGGAQLAERSAAELARLGPALAGLAGFDFVLLDCAAGGGPVAEAVVATADLVVVPVASDYLGLHAARDQLARAAPGGPPRRVLATFYEPETPTARELDAALATLLAGQTLRTRVRRCAALRHAPAGRGTVFDQDPLSPGALDHVRLAEEIETLAA